MPTEKECSDNELGRKNISTLLPPFKRPTPKQLKKAKNEDRPHYMGYDIPVPILTTPLRSTSIRTAKPHQKTEHLSSTYKTAISTTADTETDSDKDFISSNRCRVRSDQRQPYPEDRHLLYKIGVIDETSINRILIKKLGNDKHTVFVVPTKINGFLQRLFNRFATKNKETMSQQDFEKMLFEVKLLKVPERTAVTSDSEPYETMSSRKRVRYRQKRALLKYEDKSKRRREKMIEVCFRHSNNPNGDPIEFDQFLRVLHRVARYMYRRIRMRDDEAMNAIVVYLARATGIPPVRRKPIGVSTSIQTTIEMSDDLTQTETRKVVDKACFTDRQKPLEPKKHQLAQHSPSVQATTPKKIPYSEGKKKCPLSRSNFLLADQMPTTLKDNNNSTTTTTVDHQQQDSDYLRKRFYEIYRMYCDTSKGDIPMMTLHRFQQFYTNCGLSHEISEAQMNRFFLDVADETNTIDFIQCQEIMLKVGLNLYEVEEDAKSVLDDIIRDYFLPLLYEKEFTTKSKDYHSYCYHVINDQGQVVDFHNNVIDGLTVTPFGEVMDDQSGHILPGDTWTLDGQILHKTNPLSTSSSLMHRHIEQQQQHDRLLLPLEQSGQSVVQQQQNVTMEPMMGCHPPNEGVFFQQQQQQQLQQQYQFYDTQCPPYNDSHIPPHYYSSPTTKTDFDNKNLEYLPYGFYVNSEGKIMNYEGSELEGFSVGPHNSLIGPDGRPLCGVRVAETGVVEVLTDIHPNNKKEITNDIPEHLRNFPVYYADSDDDDDEASVACSTDSTNLGTEWSSPQAKKDFQNMSGGRYEDDTTRNSAAAVKISMRGDEEPDPSSTTLYRLGYQERGGVEIEGMITPSWLKCLPAGIKTPRFDGDF